MLPKGYKHTEETKRKIGLANSIVLRGRKLSEEHKKKISEARKGKHHSEEIKKKMSEAKKGNKNPAKRPEVREKMSKAHQGKKLSEETKKKLREINKKFPIKYWLGKKLSEETKRKMSESRRRYYDKKGRKLKDYRQSAKYLNWRLSVFKRDNFTCLICQKVGGELNAHHIKSWAKYPELRYDINNGITLCKDCHKMIHKLKPPIKK